MFAQVEAISVIGEFLEFFCYVNNFKCKIAILKWVWLF